MPRALIIILLIISAAQCRTFSQTENLPDKLPDDLNQKQWETVRDLYAIDAIKLLAKLDTLQLEIDSLKQLNEYAVSYDCEEELYAIVGATKEQVSDYRLKFDEAEKYIKSKSSMPDDASSVYFEAIRNSKINCLPEFAERYASLKKIMTAYVQTEETETGHSLYTVVKGDCLWKISKKKYRTTYLWPAIWEANRTELYDPNFIYPGEVLKIPVIKEEERKKTIERSKMFRIRKNKQKNLLN